MKNQKITFLAIGFVFLGLIACDSDKPTEQTVAIDNTNSATVVNDASEFPPLSSIPEITPPPSASNPLQTSINPAGPLANSVNSFSNSSAPQVIASTPQAVTNVQPVNASGPLSTQKSTKSTVRLNPAHGQPGHDCAIAVGAPLKSVASTKPASAPAAVNPIEIGTPKIEEAKTVTEPAINFGANLDKKAKLNPAHGQPGHDCAIAVGAPLPVK
jgi:hypothetical protein